MRFIKTLFILAIIAAIVMVIGIIVWDWQPFGPKYSWDNIKEGFLPQKQALEKKRSEYQREAEEMVDEFQNQNR